MTKKGVATVKEQKHRQTGGQSRLQYLQFIKDSLLPTPNPAMLFNHFSVIRSTDAPFLHWSPRCPSPHYELKLNSKPYGPCDASDRIASGSGTESHLSLGLSRITGSSLVGGQGTPPHELEKSKILPCIPVCMYVCACVCMCAMCACAHVSLCACVCVSELKCVGEWVYHKV